MSVYSHVEAQTVMHKAWNNLKELHEHENMQNKACLVRKLINMKYKDNDLMIKHMSVLY